MPSAALKQTLGWFGPQHSACQVKGDCRPATGPCAHAEPNSGNGADMGGYAWTQTLGDVVLSVPVPPGTKGRQCAVDVKKGAISVGLAGAPPLLAGELWAPVQAEECFWNVDGRALEVTLQKVRFPGTFFRWQLEVP